MVCRICAHECHETKITELYLSLYVKKDLVKCSQCESLYFSPVPTDDEIATCYVGDYRSGFFENHWKNFERGWVLGKTAKALFEHGSFLDIGCSIGSMLEGFRASSGWQISGTEFDTSCVNYCRSKGIDVKQGFIYDCIFDSKFDFILANNVLEHEPDPAKFLKKVSAILSNRGKLLLTVPNGPVDISPSICLAKRGRDKVTTNNEGHLNFFTVSGLEEILKANNLEITSIRSFHLKMALKKKFLLPGSEKKNVKNCIDRLRKPGSESNASEDIFKYSPPQQKNRFANTLALWMRNSLMFPKNIPCNDFEILCTKMSGS